MTKMTKPFRRIWFLAAALLLSSCGSDEKPPLPGERISVLEMQRHIEPGDLALDAQGFITPAAWRNEFWPQTGGYPSHSMQSLALSEGELRKAWSADIGQGATESLPLTAQPVVVDGRIFTLDTDSVLSAFSIENGKKIWQVDVRSKGEDDPVIGGGIAYSQGQIYVTNGYDEVIALSPGDGSLLWRVRIPAPARAAPSAMDSRVFVATLDNRIVTLDAATGQALWEYAGVSESTGLVGAASPAASTDIVVPAFSSGEIFALRIENGALAWAENLSAFRALGNISGLSDIRGMPVIDKGLVIAISFGGRMIAIDQRTGNRVWQREIGGAEMPWVAGNYIFVLTTESELIALGRDNGVIQWVADLPRFEDPEDHDGPIFWTGPVLAGGRLIIAGSNGHVMEFAPDTGKHIRSWAAGSSVTIPPVVAGETLYLLGDNGVMSAFR